MDNKYNIDMKPSRLQSSIGRKSVEVYKETEEFNELVLATVVRVNYLYNTVEVVTTRRNESLIKSTESGGRLSARLPVNFGGAWAGGQSYGVNVPIANGDLVLVGFLNGDINSPIVVNIYKTDSVSRDVAITNKLYGNPEVEQDHRVTLAYRNLFPSQTLQAFWGDGNYTQTFAGRTFFVTRTEEQAQGRLNDTYLNYEDLIEAVRADGTLIEPINEAVPEILFTHYTKGITSNKTTMFLDKYGTVRFSKVLEDVSKRSYFEMDNKGRIGFRHRPQSSEPFIWDSVEDAEDIDPSQDTSKDSYVGIIDGIPTIYSGARSIEVKQDEMYVDGLPLSELLKQYTAEVEETVRELVKAVQEIASVVENIDLEDLKNLQQNVISLIKNVEDMGVALQELTISHQNLSKSFNDFVNITYKNFTTAVNEKLTTLERDVGVLANEIGDARGDKGSLAERIDDIEQETGTTSGIVQTLSKRAVEAFIVPFPSTGNQNITITFAKTYTRPPCVTISTNIADTSISFNYLQAGANYTGLQVAVYTINKSGDLHVQVVGMD